MCTYLESKTPRKVLKHVHEIDSYLYIDRILRDDHRTRHTFDVRVLRTERMYLSCKCLILFRMCECEVECEFHYVPPRSDPVASRLGSDVVVVLLLLEFFKDEVCIMIACGGSETRSRYRIHNL